MGSGPGRERVGSPQGVNMSTPAMKNSRMRWCPLWKGGSGLETDRGELGSPPTGENIAQRWHWYRVAEV